MADPPEPIREPDGTAPTATAPTAADAPAGDPTHKPEGEHDGTTPPSDVDIRVDSLAAAVYGTIVAGSVMAAGAGHLSAGRTAVAVVVTVLIYWLAESYAHLLAVRVVGVSDARRAHARHRLTSSWRLVTVSFVPVAGMGVAVLLGADDRGAVLAGLLCTTGLLTILGWWAARRSDLHGIAVVGSALASGALGLSLVALKYILH